MSATRIIYNAVWQTASQHWEKRRRPVTTHIHKHTYVNTHLTFPTFKFIGQYGTLNFQISTGIYFLLFSLYLISSCLLYRLYASFFLHYLWKQFPLSSLPSSISSIFNFDNFSLVIFVSNHLIFKHLAFPFQRFFEILLFYFGSSVAFCLIQS